MPADPTPPAAAGFPGGFDDLRLSRFRVGDVTLRVRDGGSGPPLLLLHGYPETHFAWGLVAGELGPDFTVLAPDPRGDGGRSQRPAGPRLESLGQPGTGAGRAPPYVCVGPS